MNAITKQESAVNVFGVSGRAYGVVTASNGRILNQQIKATRRYKDNGDDCRITVTLRFDDECGNGHETFSITGDTWRNGREDSGGCIHDQIAQHFPELAHLIKWHLVSTDGPMHYVANTVYHADEYGPRYAWVYYTPSQSDPLGIDDKKERLLSYAKRAQAVEADGKPGYRVVWDEKTAKVRNLDHARSSAVWPDATDSDLTAPGLEARLVARLPDLLARFESDMRACGFVWPDARQ